MKRRVVLSLVFAVLMPVSPAFASPASPEASPIGSPGPAAVSSASPSAAASITHVKPGDALEKTTTCRTAPAATVAEAMAERLTDRATLHFIRSLEGPPPANRDAVVRALAAKPPADLVATAAAAAAKVQCPNDVEIAQARMVFAVTSWWNVRSDAEASQLDTWFSFVANALAARASLDAAVVTAALAPFETSIDALEAPAVVPGTCPPDGSAKTIARVHPAYPAFAGSAGESGSVSDVIVLNTDGDVEAAYLYANMAPSDVGGDLIREQSLRAAATTTYVPRIVSCKPTGGRYLFRAVFTMRR